MLGGRFFESDIRRLAQAHVCGERGVAQGESQSAFHRGALLACCIDVAAELHHTMRILVQYWPQRNHSLA